MNITWEVLGNSCYPEFTVEEIHNSKILFSVPLEARGRPTISYQKNRKRGEGNCLTTLTNLI